PPANRPHDPPVYTARGGRENTRIWWTELVDLSKLYIQAWPGDDVSKAAITFIGMTAVPSAEPASAMVSEMTLTR
ncbi:MAG: hypothetical protein HQL35_16070, partial [Alphaproteobacteria bacterium]|nr:hypothetical protein [Alphaproteobacteria bacterium]